MALARPDRAPLTVLAAPLRARWGTEPAAMVLVRDPQAQAPTRAVLRDLFGLTATEAAVTAALAEGSTLGEIAQRLGIGIGLGTVRSHLKQALAKTGTHRQAQLVALISGSVAMQGHPTPPPAAD